MNRFLFPAFISLAILLSANGVAEWPTYLHDPMRSGVTEEVLTFPLHETWVHHAQHPPKPAWPAPANQDYWHEIPKLHPVVTYDRAFHAVIAHGKLYFASSADDQLYCLDADNGALLWTFFAEAPIRLAPSIAEGYAYFSADDGRVYCLDAETGTVRWAYRPPIAERRIPGNGRIVSIAPGRTGVLVDDGIAYYCAGLFPDEGVFRGALDAQTGASRWCEKTDAISPQGYLLASPARLFVPTGRTNPALFDRESGKVLGQMDGPGGAFAVLAEDTLASGPGRRTGNTLQFSDPDSKESIATAPGTRMVVKGPMAYIQSLDSLAALDRPPFLALGRQRNVQTAEYSKIEKMYEAAKRSLKLSEMATQKAALSAAQAVIDETDRKMAACYRWRISTEHPYALILAGNTLIAGGEGSVAAFSAESGASLWTAAIPGRAYGLSVSSGRLYVSTDTGTIHCFGPEAAVRQDLAPEPDTAPDPEDAEQDAWTAAADAILQQTGNKEGYCLVMGCGRGRLLHALLQRSKLHVVGLERDPALADQARRALARAGLYGARAAIHVWDGKTLPYTTYMMNLVTIGETFSFENGPAAAEVYRLLRPYGGAACIGWPGCLSPTLSREQLGQWAALPGVEVILSSEQGLWAMMRRASVEGAGEWTQLYANANHTACSMDKLEGPMAVQWFGEPGPREIVDRHHRPMSSLFKNGRLFIPGNDVIFCADGYNGALLWKQSIPDMRRVGAMKDNGQMLVTGDLLYVAVKGACWALDVATGEHAFTLDIPETNGEIHDWGYLNCADDALIGTAEAADASFDLLSRDLVNTLEGDYRPVVVSKYLFAVDRRTGAPRWIHRRGAIMNSAITMADGRVFFLESDNPAAATPASGRMRIDSFCKEGARLVALDLTAGTLQWERPVAFPFEHIMYLNGQSGILLASGSYNDRMQLFYGLFGFDMATGNALWNTSFRAMDNQCKGYADIGGSHGEQWQHPVLIDGTIYQRPFAFDLRTGQKKEYYARRGGHGCGGLTGSAHYLFGRGDNPRMYPLDTPETDGIQLTQVSRPGCWLNIIPAGGIIMIPESSSGCTCAYPIQASFGFVPESML